MGNQLFETISYNLYHNNESIVKTITSLLVVAVFGLPRIVVTLLKGERSMGVNDFFPAFS